MKTAALAITLLLTVVGYVSLIALSYTALIPVWGHDKGALLTYLIATPAAVGPLILTFLLRKP